MLPIILGVYFPLLYTAVSHTVLRLPHVLVDPVLAAIAVINFRPHVFFVHLSGKLEVLLWRRLRWVDSIFTSISNNDPMAYVHSIKNR